MGTGLARSCFGRAVLLCAQQLARFLFEVRSVVEPRVHIANASLPIDPEDCRQAWYAVGFRYLAAVEQYAVFQLVLFYEAFDGALGFVPCVDREDHKTPLGVLFVELAQVRSLRTARRSRRGPEREHDRLATKLTQAHLFAS